MAVKQNADTLATKQDTSAVESKAVLAVAPALHTSMATLASTQAEVASLPKASVIVRQQTELLFSDVNAVEAALHLAIANLRAVKSRKDTTYYGLELCQRTIEKLDEVRAAAGDKQARLLDEAIALYARCAPFVTTAGSTMYDATTGATYTADATSPARASLKMVKRTMSAAVRLAPVSLSEANRAGVNTYRAAQASKAAQAAEVAITGGKPTVDANTSTSAVQPTNK
jgi:hypothetical protein